MLFGSVTTALGAIIDSGATNSASQSGGKNELTGGTSTGGGGIDTGWCEISYDEEELIITLRPDVQSLLGVSKQQISDMLSTLINALKELVTNVIDGCEAYSDKDYKQTICINHADCLDEALMCQKLFMENEKTANVIVEDIGPTIGCHAGPGTIAIFCFADTRMKVKA